VFHVEQYGALEHLFHECSTEIGIPTEPDQVQLFLIYLKQLQLWNQSFNLTAITKDEDVIIKHFIDSLAVLKAVNIGQGSHILDVGAGAGFPGIPLKILRPDLFMTLVEPTHKKSAFLHFMVGVLRLKNVDLFQGTVERLIHSHRESTRYDYITARALNPSLIFHTAKKLLKSSGKAIIYSSKPLVSASIPNEWRFMSNYTFELPHAYGSRTISIFSHHGDSSSLTVPRGT